MVIDPSAPGKDNENTLSLSERLQKAEHIISALNKGVALLDAELRITWANHAFRQWSGAEPLGRTILEALSGATLLWPEQMPDPASLQIQNASLQICLQNGLYLDACIAPIHEPNFPLQFLVTWSDVSFSVVRQKKLDALYRAGRELAPLDSDELTELTYADRVELLKQNLRKQIHNLLHYNVIEIRLLDPLTKELKPLLEEGMTTEAAQRTLFASIEGNGVTGYVATTATSYLCQETLGDPHYILGAAGARSSMTIPLIYHDNVIGTFNVENTMPNAFTNDDLQFAELFSREIAHALHTLDLLRAQQSCSASQVIDSVNREIALPADELLCLVSGLVEKFGDNKDILEPLQRILADARSIKQKIQCVADDFANPRRDLPNIVSIKGQHILVIDGDERVRKQAHLLLEREGCQVETVARGQEGLTLARSCAYDAVLMAIKPEDMGGTALYRTLRTILPQSRIILTQGFEYDGGHTLVNVRQDGYWLPVLYKQPFQPNQLLKALTCVPPASTHPSTVAAVLQVS